MANASEEKDLHEGLKSLLGFTALWKREQARFSKVLFLFSP